MADGSRINRPTLAPDADAPPAPVDWIVDGRGRRFAPPEVWAAVRDDYLSGLSGPEACRRHGVTLPALRDRASREGWRRADQPWIRPNGLDPEDEGVALDDRVGGNLDKVEISELWFVAHRRMLRAVLRGDAVGALRWRRVAQAMDAEQAEMERLIAQDEAVWMERFGQARADAADAVLEASTDSTD